MKFFYRNLKLTLKTSFLFLCFAPNLLGFNDFVDSNGHKIAFVLRKDQNFTRDKEIFVDSFDENYSALTPSDIKPHFKTRNNVKDWLSNVFNDEQKDFLQAKHPTHWINLTKDGQGIGFAIFEQWGHQSATWHIRQMAILPDEQRHGYGKALAFSILGVQPEITKLIADTRKANPKGRPFFKTVGFKELEKPHDPELDPQEKYVGLEWTKVMNAKEE
ncbi:MAG: GNAT family N-acetyltransferase [Proteobacteria bacterium]|nr:GNAT family N-acetyltransferase [Pseudomonadota bacterium]